MTKRTIFFAQNFFIAMALTLVSVTVVQAQEGCDPIVMDALKATAQARVAYSNSIDDEMFQQDDSVLAMTCFNRAASLSSQIGGIFSGPFTAEMAPVIEDALVAMYDDFDQSLGATSNSPEGVVVDYGASGSSVTEDLTAFECPGIRRLWEQVESEGTNPNVPYVTFNDLLNGDTAPEGTAENSNFETNWKANSSQTAFSRLRQSMVALEARAPSVMDMSGAQTPCEVMQRLGSVDACP